MLEKLFHLKENNTNVKTELTAGLATFMTMAYILAVNPSILSEAGMDPNAVLIATCLASFIGTAIMALTANLPFALSAGMGLNAYLTYTVVLGMGISWQMALFAVFIEGLLFIALTLTNVREAMFNAIPLPLKRGVSVGIGLFIAFIGLLHPGHHHQLHPGLPHPGHLRSAGCHRPADHRHPAYPWCQGCDPLRHYHHLGSGYDLPAGRHLHSYP